MSFISPAELEIPSCSERRINSTLGSVPVLRGLHTAAYRSRRYTDGNNLLWWSFHPHLDIQAICTCLLIGWEIHINDFLSWLLSGHRFFSPPGLGASAWTDRVMGARTKRDVLLWSCGNSDAHCTICCVGQNTLSHLKMEATDSNVQGSSRNLFTSWFSLTRCLLSPQSSGAGLYYQCSVRIWSVNAMGPILRQRECWSFQMKR